MPTRFARLVLFLSSYAPLMLIFGIRDPLGWRFSRPSFVALAAVFAGLLLVFLRHAQRFTPHSIAVESAQVRDGDAMSYIITYFLPFLGISRENLGDAVSLLLVYVVIGFIYINSNLIYINPILNSMGYRLFEIASATGKTSALITKRDYLQRGQELNVVSLGNYVLLEKIP